MTPDLSTWIVEQSVGRERYLFGIAGPPGSGKSTLAAELGAQLGAPVVPMDGFHLSNEVLVARGQHDVKGAPETFAATSFVDLISRLRQPSQIVMCPTFDRAIDEPVADQIHVATTDVVVIVEGNYLLLEEPPWSALSTLFDAIAYLDVPADLRLQRLIDRHVEFGRTRAEAAAFVERSDVRNAALVEASRARADLVVSHETTSDGGDTFGC